MPAIAWLGIAVVAGILAYASGWPAWRAYRAREARDLNTERYLAWRGRAPRGRSISTSEGMTADERRRIWAGAALGALAVVALIAFFVAS